MAAIYLDEAILAHIFINEDQGSWSAARDGLVLYAKTWKPVLMTTGIIVGAMYVFLLLLLLAMTPVASVLGSLSSTFEFVGWAIIGGMLLTVYYGFLDPWIKTVIITTFLIESREHTPDSETVDYVVERSSRFKEVLQNAEEEEKDRAKRTEPATAD